MVRLKVTRGLTRLRTPKISIPVWCDWRLTFDEFKRAQVIFQFQYGAIEGLPALQKVERFVNFNSSMVRLKVNSVLAFLGWATTISIPVWCDWRSAPLLYLSASSHFNSSMVRLKVILKRIYFPSITFQFQYGAIEGVFSKTLMSLFINFNSSMVRLKALSPSWNAITLLDFNSSMVRLKAATGKYSSVSWSLISIPVWCDWRLL